MLLTHMIELRDSAKRWPDEWGGEGLREMADLVCNEFEEYVKALDGGITEKYLQLPVDADGRTWHVGDEVDLEEYGHREVVAVSDKALYYWNDMDEVEWTQAHTKRHWEPTTVKGLLNGLLKDIMHDPFIESEMRRLISECADKLELRHG